MNKYSKIKSELLGINFSTASYRLVKLILFDLIIKNNLDVCFRCNKKISIKDFSIEHKEAWQQSNFPKEKFFDLDNISFSHKACNYGVAIRKNKQFATKKEYEKIYTKKRSAVRKQNYSSTKRRSYYLKTGF